MSNSDWEWVLEQTGFETCEFGGTCEKCDEDTDPLFFGHKDYWDDREGDYYCRECLLMEHEINIACARAVLDQPPSDTRDGGE